MSAYMIFALIPGLLFGVCCHSVTDHKAWQFRKGLIVTNTAIVTKTSTSRSLADCATKCVIDPLFASVYYHNTTKLCYCNHGMDVSPIISPVGQFVYGYPSLSYVSEMSDNGERNVTSSSPSACKELIREASDSGLFNGFPSNLPRISLYTYCNNFFSLDWIVFQRRQDGSVSFARPWLDYVAGFGNTSGEFWLGLEEIHNITRNNKCELNITMEAEPNHPVLSFGYAHYDIFNISGADDNYRLYVAGFTGNVGNCLSSQSGYQFSTIDVDNDVHIEVNCADYYQAAWWYAACHCCSLNGQYYAGNHTSYADGVNWSLPWGFYYSLIKVEMKVRCLFKSV